MTDQFEPNLRPPHDEKELCEHIWYETWNDLPGFPLLIYYCPKCHMKWRSVDAAPPKRSYRLVKKEA